MVLSGLIVLVAALSIWMTDYQQNEISADTSTAYAQRIYQASLIVDTGADVYTYQSEFERGDTAFDLLLAMSDQHDLAVTYDSYDFGKLVTGIDGISSDMQTGNYWMFYINSEMAMVGADSYELKTGDVVSFEYGTGDF